LLSDLYLARFLDTSAKSFFQCRKLYFSSSELNKERIKIDENSSEVALYTAESAISNDQGVFICLPLIKVRLQPGYKRENIPRK